MIAYDALVEARDANLRAPRSASATLASEVDDGSSAAGADAGHVTPSAVNLSLTF
jgi:hypothetical protein